jgi:hypothetical protein
MGQFVLKQTAFLFLIKKQGVKYLKFIDFIFKIFFSPFINWRIILIFVSSFGYNYIR